MNVVIVVVVLVVCLCSYIRSPEGKGKIGEWRVKCAIDRTGVFAGHDQYVIHDLMLETADGRTAQIDHVVINSRGVYVIETKNYSGQIYGSDEQYEWLQVLNGGRNLYHFYSPVRQNEKHLYHIRQLLGKSVPLFSLVVFVKGNIANVNSSYVHTISGARQILSNAYGSCLDSEQKRGIYEALVNANCRSRISMRQHVSNIQK